MTVEEIKQLLEDSIDEKQRLGDHFNDMGDDSCNIYYAEAHALSSILQQINEKETD